MNTLLDLPQLLVEGFENHWIVVAAVVSGSVVLINQIIHRTACEVCPA